MKNYNDDNWVIKKLMERLDKDIAQLWQEMELWPLTTDKDLHIMSRTKWAHLREVREAIIKDAYTKFRNT